MAWHFSLWFFRVAREGIAREASSCRMQVAGKAIASRVGSWWSHFTHHRLPTDSQVQVKSEGEHLFACWFKKCRCVRARLGNMKRPYQGLSHRPVKKVLEGVYLLQRKIDIA